MRAAIFGGSFDPPHIGHLQIIQKALQKLDIDVLFVVPTYLNPFKKSFSAPPNLRYKWVKKLLSPYKNVHIIDYEMQKKRPVPTIETVTHLKKEYPLEKIYLIIGADNVKGLRKWKDYDRLRHLVSFVIATRDDTPIPDNLQKLKVNATISSTKLRQKIDTKFLPPELAQEILNYYKYKEKNEPAN